MVNASSSSTYQDRTSDLGPQFAWIGRSYFPGLFISKYEANPWLMIQLNNSTVISSVIIINRMDCCGERLQNLELRGGFLNDLTNPVIGLFKGPGETHGAHRIPQPKPVEVLFLSFQLKTREYLQINGIRLRTGSDGELF